MKDENLRGQLEKRIIETSWKVTVSQTNVEWVDSGEFETFLKAWEELADYYVEHPDDTVIGVEVMREYLHITRLLKNILLYMDLGQEQREKAVETIAYFESLLENIITEVVSYNDSTRYKPTS